MYEGLEVALNADQVELLDVPKLRRQLLTIVRRGAALDHQAGQHDDYATAAALAAVLVNPDVGASSAEGWIRLYRDMPARIAAQEAAATAASQPSVSQAHSSLGFMQAISATPRGDRVLVRVPPELQPSTIYGASGKGYNVEIIQGQRIVSMPTSDARALVLSPFVPPQWRECNRELGGYLQPIKLE